MFLKLVKKFKKSMWQKVVEKATKNPQPLNSRDYYYCPECDNKITWEELDSTWNWSGPHCPHCGNTGVGMLAGVIEQEAGKKGLRSGRTGEEI